METHNNLLTKTSKLEKELLYLFPEYKNQLCYNVLKQ